jgi:DNA-binding response OmpR family regulator
MAQIAIAEPDAELQHLFGLVVSDLGHESVDGGPCDLLLLEPGWPAGRDLAERLRTERPGLPIVCVSSRQPAAWTDEHATRFVLKPFRLAELRRAIVGALSPGSIAAG